MIQSYLSRNRDSAESVVLDLALRLCDPVIFSDPSLSSSALVTLAGVLGYNESTVRMAISRLLAKQVLARGDRGEYEIGAAAIALRDEVTSWPFVLDRLTDWDGSWIAALGPSPANNRDHDRALALRGFAALRPDILVRPRNLQGGVERLRADLRKLGMSSDILLVGLDDLEPALTRQCGSLWQSAALAEAYRRERDHLRELADGLAAMDHGEWLRQSFHACREASRRLLFDPLLPSDLVDSPLRADFVATTVAFYQTALPQWRRLVKES